MPGLDDPAKAASALVKLQAALPLWQHSGPKPGYNDPAAWQAMGTFMQNQGLLKNPVDVTQAFSNAYLPA